MAHLGVAGELLDPLDQLLARRVGGVGLAGEHELHRPLGVVEQLAEAVRVGQQQRRPLVRGEAAGEADGQHRRVEHVLAEALAGQAHELVAAVVERRPRLERVDVAHPGPALGVGAVPVLADDAGQQRVDAGRGPRAAVDAVGDRADRHLVDAEVGPQALEHLPAHGAVQAGDAVRAGGQAQAHDGHVELAVGLVGPLADGEQLVEA